MSKDLSPQLALQLAPQDAYTFDSFCWGDNLLLRDQLLRLGTDQPHELFFYSWGEAGVGKSHLLQACCLQGSAAKAAVYLPLRILKSWGVEVLEGLCHQSLIAIDDIDAIAGDAKWEEALFHLMNEIRQRGKPYLLLSSRESPAAIRLQLPDLKSRLYWGLITQLLPLQDTQKMQVLQRYARQRGFELSDRVASFLMKRFDRDMHSLMRLLKQLDQYSLAAQRPITVPFVRQLVEADILNSLSLESE